MPYGITQCYLPPDRGENPAEAGTRFSDPGGMQGWVDLCYVKATGRELKPRPVNRKSNALPLSHHAVEHHSSRTSYMEYLTNRIINNTDNLQKLGKCWDKRLDRITANLAWQCLFTPRGQSLLGGQFLRSRGFKTSCNKISSRKTGN